MFKENKNSGKLSGYLEKKGRLRIGSLWRKYWFVLEGRLLLYYRSKDEYDTIRPCKGSVSLCPPCNVKLPQNSSCIFQIECRCSTVTLRAENRFEQERWMQAIMLSISQTKTTPNKLNHFRYSLDDLPNQIKVKEENIGLFIRQNTLPYRFKSPKRERKQTLLQRLQDDKNENNSKSAGSLNIVSKEKYVKSPRLPKNKNLSRLLKQSNSLHNVVKESASGVNNLKDISQSCEDIVEDNSEDSQKNRNWKSEGHLLMSKTSIDKGIDEENESKNLCNNNNYDFEVEEGPETMRKFVRNNSLKYACKLEDDDDSPYEDLDNICIRNNKPNSINSKENEDNLSQGSSGENKSKEKGSSKIKTFLKLVKSNDGETSSKKVTRNQSFVRRMWKRKSKNFEEDVEKVETISQNEKQEFKNLSDNQLLLHLQKIMESRKHSLLLKNTVEIELKTQQKEDLKTVVNTENIIEDPDEEKPSLPPRQFYRRPSSPYHDTPRSCKPTTEKFISRCSTPQNPGNYKTIEEILEELDEQKQFDHDVISRTDSVDLQDVVLRKKRLSPDGDKQNGNYSISSQDTVNRKGRYSSELEVLLEELAKITSAPVLTPGNTCSLIVPFEPVSEEWLKNLPSKRRMSDPDYDIPRPHASLQFNNRSSFIVDENAIPSTQFFGPVLQSSPPKLNSPILNRYTSWNSIDPDSLEPVDLHQKKESFKTTENWEKNISYTSHGYNHFYHQISDDLDDKSVKLSYNCNIYKESIISCKNSNNNESNANHMNKEKKVIYNFKEELEHVNVERIKETLVKGQEQFIDSLEPTLTEVRTSF